LFLDGIAYAFLGKELGGRPSDPSLYCNGVADYEKMATTESFKNGLKRVVEEARKHHIALMCAEPIRSIATAAFSSAALSPRTALKFITF